MLRYLIPRCAYCRLILESFDNISHTYLFEILIEYGFGECFRQRMRRMFENTTSKIQMNGQRTSPMQISRSILQGCPMSMLLFALCLNQLLCTLECNLVGIRIGRSGVKTATVAYANDLTIFATKTRKFSQYVRLCSDMKWRRGQKSILENRGH